MGMTRLRHSLMTVLLAFPSLAPAAELPELLAARLALMADVAAYKYQHGQPIEDAAREAVVLAGVRDQALRFGLVPDTVARLFEAQIEAAKAVQAYWFAEWDAGRAAPPAAPDLAGAVRPALLRLGGTIVAAAGSAGPVADRAAFEAALTMPGLNAAERDALYEAVRALRRFPNRLAQIQATGRLRIGTTGDYPPFSYQAESDSDLAGIDIDLAYDLAAALGVEAEFVLTSWPGLRADLEAGHYDIAMSGVSRSLDRARVGFLSQPYYADGKTPIARCEDRRRFSSFARIDQPGVRVVVNPGGTNERFVDTRIRAASKQVHPDNRTIFEEILAGRADVMFTDRIEVELQTRRHRALCAMLKADLTYQEKAYLLPQDPVWLTFVDTWITLRLAEGAVDAAFAQHGFIRHPPRVSAAATQ
jgi:cyclohexadienyl dehydratase